MFRKFVIVLIGCFVLFSLVNSADAQQLFRGGSKEPKKQLTSEEYKLIHEDFKKLQKDYISYLKNEGWPEAFDYGVVQGYDIEIATSMVNIYFEAIRRTLFIPKFDSSNIQADFTDSQFLDYVREWDKLPENREEYKKLEVPKIGTDSKQGEIGISEAQYILCQNLNARIKFWSDFLNYKKKWTDLLTVAMNTRSQQQRLRWYRIWYVLKYEENFVFKPAPDDFRKYIFENFTVPPNGYGTTEANSLLNWKENSGLEDFLDSEDCQKRPWYVVDRFFMYMNLERFQKCEGYEDLRKFLPANRSELGWNREFLKGDQYTENINVAVKNWLILKFGYSKDSPELQNKDLKQLLDLLKENIEAVRPYHRFLYDQIQDESLKNFLNHVIN